MVTPADGLEDYLSSFAWFGSLAALFVLVGVVSLGVRWVIKAGRQV